MKATNSFPTQNVKPYKCWNEMTIIPYNFLNVHYFWKSFDFSLIKEFRSAEYLIMDFHQFIFI